MLSAGGQVTVEWPVAILLATRNDKPVARRGKAELVLLPLRENQSGSD